MQRCSETVVVVVSVVGVDRRVRCLRCQSSVCSLTSVVQTVQTLYSGYYLRGNAISPILLHSINIANEDAIGFSMR